MNKRLIFYLLCIINYCNSLVSVNSATLVTIQNNTGDKLRLKASNTATPKILDSGSNTVSLNLSSLLQASPTDVVSSAMIEIVDKDEEIKLKKYDGYNKLKVVAYIQVLTGQQLTNLCSVLNGLVTYSYDQNQSFPGSFTSQYLVVTNFNPTINSSSASATFSGTLSNLGYTNSSIIDCYRMQIIDIGQLQQQSYTVTLQINKENLGYGVVPKYDANNNLVFPLSYSLNQGIYKDYYIPLLQPSIVSCNFNNVALRPVTDMQGNLLSGQILKLDNAISLIECDTLDAGNNFNQDIPMLNLFDSGKTDANDNQIIVANQAGAEFINLSATFGTLDPSYSNVMMFSLPTQALLDGVNVEVTQPSAGSYQLIITSIKAFPVPSNSSMVVSNSLTTDSNIDAQDNSVAAGSVLTAPKVFVNQANVSNVTIDFLHVQGDSSWVNPQSIASTVKKFTLKYSSTNTKNSLSINGKSKKSSLVDYLNAYTVDMNSTNQAANAHGNLSTFNFNTTNTGYGFSFIRNPWNNSKGCSADISAIFGLTDFKIAFVGVDNKNNPILTVEDKSKIDHFEVSFYDKNNRQIGNSIAIPLDGNHVYNISNPNSSVEKNSIINDISTSFALGVNTQGLTGQNASLNYPFIIEFNNVKPFSFLNSQSVDIQGKPFISFNFNTNNYGFAFIQNPWTGTNKVVAADISSAIAGKSSFKFMILGADKNNLPVYNLSNNQNVNHLNAYVYDDQNSLIQGPVSILLDAQHVQPLNPGIELALANIIGDVGPYFVLGSNPGSSAMNINYPFLLEFQNIKPAAIAVSVSKDNGKKGAKKSIAKK